MAKRWAVGGKTGLASPEGGGTWGLDPLSDAQSLVLAALGAHVNVHVGLLSG